MSTPISVLHAVRSDSFAGVERHVAVLARGQAKAGNFVHVVGGHRDLMRHALAGSGCHFTPATSVGEVAAALGAATPQVINAHMTGAEVATLVAWGARRIPLVATRHFAQPRLSGPKRLFAPVLRRRVGVQIAVSKYVADRIDGIAAVVYAGVHSPSNVPHSAQRERVVLVAQRLQPEKQTDLALRAFAESGLGQMGWRLWVAGAGPEEQQLRGVCLRLGLAPVTDFLGRRSDLPALMCRASLLVAPAPGEHFGLTVLEAMGAGLPVVAAGSAGHLETVGNVAGAALFRPGDVPHAATLLARMATSPGERDRYATEALNVQRRTFTVERQVKQVDQIYRRLL